MFKSTLSVPVRAMVVAMVFIFIVGTGLGSKAMSQEYTFKYGYWSPAHLSCGVANEKWSRLVEKLSKGRIKIENFPAGIIAGEHQSVALIKPGTLDLAQATTQNMGQFTDIYRPFDVFYVGPSAEALARLFEKTATGKALDVTLQKTQGFKSLFFQPWAGFRSIFNSKREVRLPKDLAGLKLRSTATPIEQSSLRAMGANPVPLPFQEIYIALQQGMLNGMHTDLETFLDSRFDEVCKFGTLIDGQQAVEETVMDVKKWNSLPKDLQQAFLDATEQTFVERIKISMDAKAGNIKKAEQKGVKIYQPTAAELNQWKNTTREVAKDLAAKGLIDLNTLDKISKELAEIQKTCTIQ